MVIGSINPGNYLLAVITWDLGTLNAFDFKACQRDNTGKYGIDQNQEWNVTDVF